MNARITAEPFADGIYFGLDEIPYHADPALGSTDLKALYAEPAAYWYGSHLNPDRPEDEEDKAHRIFGRAVHKFVLEGHDAFHEQFVRQPDGADLLRTSDDLAAWLKEKGEKVPASKPARIEAIRACCEGTGLDMPRIFDVLMQGLAEAGLTVLKPEDYDRILTAGGGVRSNPHLSNAFQGGISEVSVFWTDIVDSEPVRRKARFDYLKPGAVVDLKSTRPRDNMPFIRSCLRALGEWNYPTQAAAYLHGRVRLPELVAAGRVFGDHDPVWLKRVADDQRLAFVFVFWASVGAPLTWGGIMSRGNPVLDMGETYVRGALENYVAARRFHGLEAPWIDHQPLAEIELDHLPRWYVAA